MVNLKTTYLGLELKNPLIAASSPLSEKTDTIRKLEESGAAAIIMHSVFEEQLAEEALAIHTHLEAGTESYAEALSYFPEPDEFHVGPEEYLQHIREAKKAVSIPVIASLNGTTVGGWIDFARQIETAGADAIECNVYYLPTDPDENSHLIESRYFDVMKAVKAHVSVPVSIKLGPYFTNIARIAGGLANAGADGLVLFNRFYQPDIDLERLEVKPDLQLSTSYENRLALRWIALLYGRIQTDLSATGGIHTGLDAVKMIMAGAHSVQLCSVLLKNGPDFLKEILLQMASWMEAKDYRSIEQMRGSLSQKHCPDPSAFERANYMKTLIDYPR